MIAAVYNNASLRTLALLLLLVHAASSAKWAAQVRSRSGKDAHDVALSIARDLNMLFDGRVGELFDTFAFSDHDAHRAVRADGTRSSTSDKVARMREEPGTQHSLATGDGGDSAGHHPALQANKDVLWHSEQRPLSRSKRGFNDPLFADQWYLVNQLRTGNDLNITGVWGQNVTGRGVIISIVDDGVEMDHPDLKDSYSAAGSIDLNGHDKDPSPRYDKENSNHHGTRCAGEIVAHPNNSVCGVGVSYGAQVSGTRVLDGDVTDSMEASAFGYAPNVNDIYSCSWGPDDDGMTVDGPRPLAKRALQHGIVTGRHNLGSLYVVASGNGGRHQDNCNFDGYANSIYTLTIGGITEDNRNPAYNEPCAATMAVSYSSAGGLPFLRAVTTTDLHHKCTNHHTGTSAAAPLVAGLLALVLEVRPCLTWRDIQYLIVMTATKVRSGAAWMTNDAGLEHSYEHGFGVLSAWRLVQSAKTWKLVPRMLTWRSPSAVPANSHLKLANKTTHSTITVPPTTSITALEHVVVMVHVSVHRRGALRITLMSPNGTESVLATPRPLDEKGHGLHNWNFSTVRNWGESPEGEWTLTVQETDVMNRHGVFHSWRLTLLGTSETTRDIEERRRMLEFACGGNGPDEDEVLSCESRNATEPQDGDDLPDTDGEGRTIQLSLTMVLFLVLVTILVTMLCAYATWACAWQVKRSLADSTHPAMSKAAATLTGITIVQNRSHGGNGKDQRGAYSILNNADDSYALGVYDSVAQESGYGASRTLSSELA